MTFLRFPPPQSIMSEEQKDQMKWAVKNGDLAAAKALIAAEASLASDDTPSISFFFWLTQEH